MHLIMFFLCVVKTGLLLGFERFLLRFFKILYQFCAEMDLKFCKKKVQKNANKTKKIKKN